MTKLRRVILLYILEYTDRELFQSPKFFKQIPIINFWEGIGEGTTEVSILGVEGGIFEVKSVAGNAILGGDDLDNRLVNYFAQEFKKRYKTNISFI